MILDVLENAHRYPALHGGFESAFEFLMRPDLKDLPLGRYEIDGRRVYAVISSEPGREKAAAKLEIHRKYIDIQLILAGTDSMGWKPAAGCARPAGAYDEQTDLRFFSDPPDAWITVRPGAFVIFFPEDAHMPMISKDLIHKVVVKVEAEKIDTP